MKIIPFVIFFILAITASGSRAVESFQIKGLRLGQSSQSACGKAAVTSRLDDLVAKYKARAPDLIPMDITECHVAAETFGGLNINGGINLLFLSGRLIQVKFELQPMHWMKYGEIFDPLEQMYGKPTITKDDPFTTHTWRQNKNVLSISRADNSSGVESLEIILRDEISFSTYEERSEIDRAILGRLDDDQTKSDIRD